MNKIEGKILKYNGHTGLIVDENNYQYLMTSDNIKNNVQLKVGDIVLFLPELFKTIEIEERIALFIEKKDN